MRILYGVAGEGMGHATRSEVVLDFLSKKHDIHVLSSHHAFSYLGKKFPCSKIDYFKIIYRNNKAARFYTFWNNTARFPFIVSKLRKINQIIKKFNPHIIITDFEPLVAYAGLLKKIPIISIDNQHIISRTTAPLPPSPLDKFFMGLITSTFVPKSRHYFTTSFCSARPRKKNTTIIPPLLRNDVLKLKPSQGEHILVYQTSTSNKKLLPTLKSINHPFIVYGFHKNEKKGNVQFKKNKNKDFLHDLARCKAVLTNGGFSLMGEALYLKKPVLSIPIEHHFEQLCNAHMLHQSGYGKMASTTNPEILKKFLEDIPSFRKKLRSYSPNSNHNALQKIEKRIKSL